MEETPPPTAPAAAANAAQQDLIRVSAARIESAVAMLDLLFPRTEKVKRISTRMHAVN